MPPFRARIASPGFIHVACGSAAAGPKEPSYADNVSDLRTPLASCTTPEMPRGRPCAPSSPVCAQATNHSCRPRLTAPTRHSQTINLAGSRCRLTRYRTTYQSPSTGHWSPRCRSLAPHPQVTCG
ncbi:uncharacterized protein BDW43DRAFT_151861 [Aspergillus alliaceus]|uniref:uncharacterized protein n=1 Tax=Petromyces alliaceus TaxID=209559 RepID=UPI0012A6DB67|nr:uncharacterized protein BDW43DRAFT_151861 [Aspergillus alliaceus]KAB8238017.1 hypothetical protein BDW43DRAFT_151861 [Aspergillus alliaceus]